ncbi:hypothetical protein DLM_0150 [Aquitalea magnusonii]|uniref:Solute-binding protein family 3/N-terminal domain-containing protein n=1 Tax=Aquitalea magnusonii TaxID=332411 RepID=A0A3G9GAG0_9NEIS|nr:hypothetical protein [Aquitalea magnusonii]BBF83833.1 hypothetical protein DLM_0150 [Aquitalea magnusonii]
MYRWIVCCVLAVLLSPSASAAVPPVPVRYALVSGLEDPHLPYMLSLLQLACDEVALRCQLQAATTMNQSRAMVQMGKRDGGIDLFWGMTSREREQQAIPIRIPLDKGLLGWRVALVNASEPDVLAGIRDVRQLARLVAGQVADWPDTAILRNAGLQVRTSQDYGNLFPMLQRKRFDYFPRSVIEVQREAAFPVAKGLLIDRNLVLHYPTAMYFFVSPHKPELASQLEQGLRKALKDGRFNQLFQRYNGQLLSQLALAKRQEIPLANPLLPAATPLQDSALWYHP